MSKLKKLEPKYPKNLHFWAEKVTKIEIYVKFQSASVFNEFGSTVHWRQLFFKVFHTMGKSCTMVKSKLGRLVSLDCLTGGAFSSATVCIKVLSLCSWGNFCKGGPGRRWQFSHDDWIVVVHYSSKILMNISWCSRHTSSSRRHCLCNDLQCCCMATAK